MSLSKYAAYKDSGVPWLGEVPSHWSWASLKWISKRYSGGTPDKTKHEYWEEGTVPWLNSGAVNDQKITEPSAYITEQAFDASSAKWIPSGALVMALAGQGKTKGMVAQVLFQTTCNQSMAAIVPSTEVCERYLYWWLVRNYQNIRNMAGGDLRDGLNLELLGSIPCPLPLVTEQSAIAAFLDRETGKLDELIAEQEKLLALLAEKRHATISQAVTTGLNPDAAMKDSCVEWLGEVPAHWEIAKVSKSTTKITNGYVGPTRDILVDDGVPYIQATHIKGGQIRFGNDYFVRVEWSQRHSKSILSLGDVLIVQTGAGTGDIGLVSSNEVGFNCHALIILSPDRNKLDGAYLAQVLKSSYGQTKLTSIQTGAMHPHLNCGEVKFVDIPVPPLIEQFAISEFLERMDRRYDGLVAESKCSAKLLKERRSALIAAAVTGKIDVRKSA